MRGFSIKGLCALAVLTLAGCGAPPPPGTAAGANASPPPEQLNRIVERYWDERLPTENAISPQYLADSLNVERRYLADADAFPRERLDADSRLTYDIFKRRLEITVEGFTFPAELTPINPFGGMTQDLAAAAAELAHSQTAADYEAWLRRIDEYVSWTRQAKSNMREGVRRGYTSPRTLIERMLPILEQLGADDPGNVLNGPLRSMPDAIAEPERTRLTKALSNATQQELLPAIRALHDYLQQEYLPRARTGIALSELPLGARWYAYRVRRATGLEVTPEEIHLIGLAEAERIAAQAPAAQSGTLSSGTAANAAAASGAALVTAYDDLEEKVRSALPDLFSAVPKEDIAMRTTEWLRVPGMPLLYRRAGPAGVPPAVLYIDAGRGAAHEAVLASFLQQALPGHHFQIAQQRERLDLPRFRRFGDEPAFVEGWGLYAASLGGALGLYTDDAAKAGAALLEMRCAAAAVVDTGLHAKGWTRGHALDYLRAHLPIEELDAQSLVDWYASNPADALACMVGEREILAMRARAQQLLGGHFEIRQFHAEILKEGAMPLDILEMRMKAWMDASK